MNFNLSQLARIPLTECGSKLILFSLTLGQVQPRRILSATVEFVRLLLVGDLPWCQVGYVAN